MTLSIISEYATILGTMFAFISVLISLRVLNQVQKISIQFHRESKISNVTGNGIRIGQKNEGNNNKIAGRDYTES